MPLGTIRGTVSGGSEAALLSSAEAQDRRPSRVGAGGPSWARTHPAHAHAKKRAQTPCTRTIVGTPNPPYRQPDATPETSVACGPPRRIENRAGRSEHANFGAPNTNDVQQCLDGTAAFYECNPAELSCPNSRNRFAITTDGQSALGAGRN